MVSGRQFWRGTGVDREYLLYKLREFHRTHGSDLEQTVADMHEAFPWLPKSTYESEAQSLAKLAKPKRRGATSIGDRRIPLFTRLGVRSGKTINSKSSKASSPRWLDVLAGAH